MEWGLYLVVTALIGGGIFMGSLMRNNGGFARYARGHNGRSRGPQISDGFDLVYRGVEVWLRIVRLDRFTQALEIRASIRVPCGVRIARRHQWTEHRLPRMATPPSETAVPPGLEDAWANVVARATGAVLVCDDRAVMCNAHVTIDGVVLDALLDAVVAIASWDDGLADRLAALPRAAALTEHELDPGVSLEPDGLLLGVRDRAHMVAQLGFASSSSSSSARVTGGDVAVDGELPGAVIAELTRAGDGELVVTPRGARFTWTAIERDPARLRGGIAALRAAAGAGDPYR